MFDTPAHSRCANRVRTPHSRLCPNLRTLFAERWESVDHHVPLSMRADSRSVTGNCRQWNEDRCVADVDHGVFLVVDGVGGHRGGQEASEVVAGVLSQWLSNTVRCAWRDGDIIGSAIVDAVEAAREEMIEQAEKRPDFRRMAATMALGLVVEDTLYVAHAGDCRAYLLHRSRLQRLTKDQTFVQSAIDAGLLTEETARDHAWCHVVTNTVGVKPLDQPIEVDELHLSPGDRVLLCSDGLTDVVTDERLRELLMSFEDSGEAVDALVDEALKNDSKDNVTCVVVDMLTAETSDEACP